MHHDSANFESPYSFRPEKWLEANRATKERMQQAYFPFGAGSRTCIGKNIAMLVLLKALPRLSDRFVFEAAGELKHGRDMPTTNVFLIKASAFPAVVKSRTDKAV
jgi:cytochrome P450